MPRRTSLLAAVPIALTLVSTVFGASGASAQLRGPTPLSRTQYGVGYVVDAPESMAGASAYVLWPAWGGIGVYVDAKFDVSLPSDDIGYDATVTSSVVAQNPEAEFLEAQESWKSFNVALFRPLTPSLIGYVGAGVAMLRTFDVYAGPDDLPYGFNGVALVRNPEADETRANFLAGILMRMTRHVSAQFGYETQPDGVTVGVSLRLPPW